MLASKPHHASNGSPHLPVSPLAAKKSDFLSGFCKRLYGQAFKDKAVARLLPPESAALEVVAREVGVGAGTLGRWREAVITTAAMNEAGKSAWCREHGVYPADLDKWRASCATALAVLHV